MSETLSVALLVRGPDVPAWQARAVETMLARTDAEVTTVVECTESTGGKAGGLDHYLDRVRKYPLWTPVGAAVKLGDTPAHQRPRAVADIAGIGDPETLAVAPEPASDFGNVLPDRAVEVVGETDVAIRFGFGVLKGDVLDAPEYGVLSFHHGDIRKYRGMPSGFWEFLHGEDAAGVTLQRLTETLDGGSIAAYEPVDLSDARTWAEVRERLFAVSDDVLVTGIRNVAAGVAPESPDELGDLYSLPEGGDVLKYVLKESKGRVRQVVG
ncbi:formyltransferase family protein [Halorussus pelagicus]|uniref:formyltransferase family protein n=1 Tax=Halorussus pelagicus TaxID=2505977 RepID=UPI000FFC4040|nr:formyltransferase family protein [Halorussus pelagicus]